MTYVPVVLGVTMSKVVTANLLATGAVVFAGPEGDWVGSLGEARVFADDNAAEQALALAQSGEKGAAVVDPFLAPIEATGGGEQKMTLRDRIRAFGPTVRYGDEGSGR